MMSGDILLAHLPQADGIRKYRPVFLLGVTPPHGDFLVCGLTSSFESSLPNFDEPITDTDSDYASSGLKGPSLIRPLFLALLPASRFKGRIGAVLDFLHQDRQRRPPRLGAERLDKAVFFCAPFHSAVHFHPLNIS